MKLSLKAKIALAFGAIVLTGIVSTVVTVSQLTSISEAQLRLEKVRMPLALAAERSSRISVEVGLFFRNYILYRDNPELAAKYDKMRRDGWKKIFDEIANMRALTDNPAEVEILKKYEIDSQAGTNMHEQVMAILSDGKPDPQTRALRRIVELGPMMARSQKDCAELNQSVLASLDQETKRLKYLQSTARLSSTIMLGMMLSMLTLVGWTLTHRLSLFVATLNQRAQMIAEGDLSAAPLPDSGGDEMAMVFASMNRMQSQLTETIRTVSRGASQVATASEEISSSAGEIARSAESQKDQAAQVATAMQEMAVTVSQVGDASSKASESAQAAGDMARKGGEIVAQAVAMIQSVAESTRDTTSKMEALGRSSDQIGVIIGVINDIADQTNLLALNAAIEAARAGEQGRGFAVVADEVRKLAERTTGATKEVGSMIATIQTEAKNAVSAMEAGTARVDNGVKAANEAQTALGKIIERAVLMQDMVSHIATAAVEQTSAAHDVNLSMDEIARMTQQSSVSAQESAKACQDLSELGLDLQQAVSRFNTGDASSNYRTPPKHSAHFAARVH